MTRQESQELNAAIEIACSTAGFAASATKFAAITYYVTFGNIDPTYAMIHRLAGEELSMCTRRKLWSIHHQYSRRPTMGSNRDTGAPEPMEGQRGERRCEVSELIQWPKAKYWTAQWNPIIGCKPCSPACENCYAAAWAKRFRQSFEPHATKQKPPRKGVVFCGNMTDLFGEWMNVMDSMDCFSLLWHFPDDHSGPKPNDATYLFCTKRVVRMCDALLNYTQIPHAYFGFTAENQEWFERRIEQCIDIPDWVNLWLSLEPLLGAIDLYPIIRRDTIWSFKWVVVGCESGPNRRPCKIEWVESIVEQCRAANVPVFVKQLDIGGKCVTDINKFPEHLRIRQVPWVKEGGAK